MRKSLALRVLDYRAPFPQPWHTRVIAFTLACSSVLSDALAVLAIGACYIVDIGWWVVDAFWAIGFVCGMAGLVTIWRHPFRERFGQAQHPRGFVLILVLSATGCAGPLGYICCVVAYMF